MSILGAIVLRKERKLFYVICEVKLFQTILRKWTGRRVQGGTHGQILLRPALCTYLTPSPTNQALYRSRAVQIRLRTILSFIQSYKIRT